MSGTPESVALWAAGVAPGVTPVFPPLWCRTEPGQGGAVPDFDPVHCLEIWKSGNLEIWGAGLPGAGKLENWKSDLRHGLAPCRVPGFQNFRFSPNSRRSGIPPNVPGNWKPGKQPRVFEMNGRYGPVTHRSLVSNLLPLCSIHGHSQKQKGGPRATS